MSQIKVNNYQTANLIVSASTNQVTGLKNDQTVRLSPLNFKVLLVLLNNQKNTTSRQQLFEQVWPNQVISDDALTRCISDLRSQLKPLTSSDPLIETIPKVGYRWLPPVTISNGSPIIENSKPVQWQKRINSTIAIVAMLLLTTWSILATIKWWTEPEHVPLIILPVNIKPELNVSDVIGTTSVSEQLKQAALKHKSLQFLSQYAVQSHQGNPFPYFSHEFGVRWFIESQISQHQESLQVTLNLVDAKTALVILSEKRMINDQQELVQLCEQFMLNLLNL